MQTRKILFKTLGALIAVAVLLALLPGSHVQADPSTITVCASGCDYTTIQAAIDAANAGDTIAVGEGSYIITSSINVNKSLTIEGAGPDKTEVRFQNISDYGYVFFVTAASDVTLSDMTVGATNYLDRKGYFIGGPDGGFITTQNLVIDNITFDGGRSAIMISGEGQVVKKQPFYR